MILTNNQSLIERALELKVSLYHNRYRLIESKRSEDTTKIKTLIETQEIELESLKQQIEQALKTKWQFDLLQRSLGVKSFDELQQILIDDGLKMLNLQATQRTDKDKQNTKIVDQIRKPEFLERMHDIIANHTFGDLLCIEWGKIDSELLQLMGEKK